MILRQPVAVGLYEVVHKAADLIDGQFAPGMGVQHGGLIDVLLLPGESGIYGELVHLDLPPIQRGELIGKRPHVAGGEMTLVYHTGDFHTGIEGQVVNKPSIENVTSKSKGSAGLQCLDDAGGVLGGIAGENTGDIRYYRFTGQLENDGRGSAVMGGIAGINGSEDGCPALM